MWLLFWRGKVLLEYLENNISSCMYQSRYKRKNIKWKNNFSYLWLLEYLLVLRSHTLILQSSAAENSKSFSDSGWKSTTLQKSNQSKHIKEISVGRSLNLQLILGEKINLQSVSETQEIMLTFLPDLRGYESESKIVKTATTEAYNPSQIS